MPTVKVGGRPATEVSGGPKIEDIKALNGALYTYDTAIQPGGDLSTAAGTGGRTWGGNKADAYVNLTASGVVKGSPGYFYGYEVTVSMGAGAITIYDNASAASGTILMIIPASTTAPNRVNLATPIPAVNGIYASFASTGTVNFLRS